MADAADALRIASTTIVRRRRRGARQGEPRRRPRASLPTASWLARAPQRAARPGADARDRDADGRGGGVRRHDLRHAVAHPPAAARAAIGQQIRDDGPIEHPHVAKAGTPTMGGIAIVVATVVGYLVAHVRRKQHRVRDVGLDAARVDRRARRRRLHRRLPRCARPPQPRAAQAGQDVRHRRDRGGVRVARGRLRAHSTHLSFTRPLGVDLGKVGWFVFAVADRLRDRQRGEPHRRSRRARRRFVGVRVRGVHDHRVHRVPAPARLRRAARRRRSTRRSSRPRCSARAPGFLWWNAAPARSSWATPARSRSAARWRASRCSRAPHCCCRSSPACRSIETLSVIAQVISYRGFRRRVLRMAPIHHHFEVGGWSEFTVIVRFWLFAGHLRRARRRHLLRRLPAHPRAGDRVMRAVRDRPRRDGYRGDAPAARRGLGGDRRRGRARDHGGLRRAGGRGARGSARELVEAPAPDAVAELVERGRSRRAEPAGAARPRRRSRPRARAGVPVRSEIDLAAERATVPIVAVTGTNGKTTVTTLIAAMLDASGDARRRGREHRPAADRRGRRRRRRARRRGVVVPARVLRDVPPARRGRARDHARPSRLARQLPSSTSRPRRGSPSARPATTCSCSTPTTPTRRRSPRRTRARAVGFSRARATRSGYAREVDGQLARRRRPELAAGRATCGARSCTIARTRSRRRRRRSRSARRTDGIRAALASYATLPHRVALVGEAGGVQLVRRLEGDQPRRDPARARIVRLGRAARRRSQQGSRPRRCSAAPPVDCAVSSRSVRPAPEVAAAFGDVVAGRHGCSRCATRCAPRGAARAARRRRAAVAGVRVVRRVRELRRARRRLRRRGPRLLVEGAPSR